MTGKIDIEMPKTGAIAGLIPVSSELHMTIVRADGSKEELGVVASSKMPAWEVRWRKFLRLIGKG